MPNVLGSIWNGFSHAVSTPVKGSLQMITNPKKGFNTIKHNFGDQERYNQKIAQSLGIHGWVGKHPTESVGMLVATIFGGWAAWGAYGAGAAGGAAAGAAGSAGAGAGATAGVGAGTAATTAGSSSALLGGGSAMAYAPTASSAFVGGSAGATGGVGAAGFGSTGVGLAGESTASLGISGAGSTAFPALTAPSYAGALGSGSGWMGSSAAPISNSGMGWQDWVSNGNRAYNAMKGQNGQQQQQQLPPVQIDYNSVKAPTFNTGQSSNPFPNSTSDIINQGGNGSGFNAQSFGDKY